jgi:O-antigen/teichoic acid export membrane protein
MIAGSVLLGQRRFERQAVGMFVYATAKALAIGFLVWRGFSVPGALIGNALSSLVGFAVMFGPWEGLSVEFRQTVAEARGMGIAGVPFLAQNVIVGITSHVDLWFVQAIIGGVAVGLYGAAAALAEIPAFLLAALSRGLLPSVARADAENDEQLVGRYATQGVRLALLVTILGVAVVAATGRALLSFVYLPAVAGAAVPFTILMIAAAGANVRDTCADVLLARDRRRSVLWIAGASLGLAAALLLVLTPRYGIAGAAWAAAIASLAAGAATAYTLRKSISGRVLLTLLRASAAAAIVGVALAFIGPVRLWLLIAYPVAAVAYVALLLLMREFDDADVAAVRGAISRGA